MKINKTVIYLFLLALCCGIISCGDNDITAPTDGTLGRGDLVSYNSQIILSPFFIETTLRQFGEDVNFDLLYTVEVISIVYKTIDTEGNLVDASGALVVPLSDKKFPLISLHHGTQTKRQSVGSVSFINSFEAVVAGSIGYVACSPDYLGLGKSDIVHPYHYAEASASVCIDFLIAAQQYCEQMTVNLNEQLFLAGYSEGGYVTLAVQKELEANYTNDFTVTASAPMAGAHDLYETALYVVSESEYERPSFLAYLVYAYNDVYKWNNLDYFFQEPFNETIPTLYDGLLATWEIDNSLPSNLSDLFTGEFLSDFNSNQADDFINALNENSLLDWTPQAPITIIHGDADTYVPYFNAVKAQQQLKANGAPYVDVVTIEGGDHGSSLYPAILATIKWFNAFRTPNFALAE